MTSFILLSFDIYVGILLHWPMQRSCQARGMIKGIEPKQACIQMGGSSSIITAPNLNIVWFVFCGIQHAYFWAMFSESIALPRLVCLLEFVPIVAPFFRIPFVGMISVLVLALDLFPKGRTLGRRNDRAWLVVDCRRLTGGRVFLGGHLSNRSGTWFRRLRGRVSTGAGYHH